MDPASLNFLFHSINKQGTLRGTPYFWQELEQVFAHLQLPQSAADIDALLFALYHNLVGEPLVAGRRPLIARFNHGGMSGGQIESDFWLETGFPSLKRRMLELVAQTATPAAASSIIAKPLRAALLGLAVGDALGVPVEFKSRTERRADPVTGMRAYGTHQQPAGTWSDDASLTFCLAEAIVGGFTLPKLARNCARWYYENYWTPHGHVFDIGITTREALQRLQADPELVRAGSTSEQSNGNGALMRILPLAFYREEAPLSERFQLIFDVSAVTHGHIRSAVACFLYLEMARHLRAALSPVQAYARLCQQAPAQLRSLPVPASEVSYFERILGGRLSELAASTIQSSGYVLHTLEAALWCLLRHHTYAETVLAAVNLGDDTDTTGAVTGGLAGLCYGEEAIPMEWRQALSRQGDIEFLAQRMANQLGKTNGIAALPLLLPPRPLPNSYWATPAVLGCEYPGDLSLEVARTKIKTLLEAGITDFIDLTNPGELTSYEQLLIKLAAERGIAVRYCRFAIPDVDVPTPETLEAALTALDKAVAAGGKRGALLGRHRPHRYGNRLLPGALSPHEWPPRPVPPCPAVERGSQKCSKVKDPRIGGPVLAGGAMPVSAAGYADPDTALGWLISAGRALYYFRSCLS